MLALGLSTLLLSEWDLPYGGQGQLLNQSWPSYDEYSDYLALYILKMIRVLLVYVQSVQSGERFIDVQPVGY